MTDALSHLPGYALRRAANAMMSELAARLAASGLRISEASVLMLLEDRDDATSSEIGRILDIQRANMAPLLSRLETSGWIERIPVDRKSSAIVLTAAGKSKMAEAKRVTAEFESDLMARVPARHREHLVPALNALWSE
jgi:DNA-binding MarR family transcriptional regulator